MKKLRPDCSVCTTFLEAVRDCTIEEYRMWPLGTVPAIFADSDCDEHKLFIEKHLVRGLDSYESLHISAYKGCLSLNYCQKGDDGKEWTSRVADLLVLDSTGKAGVRQGRRLDSKYIDTELIRKWMSYCDNHHGLDCSMRTQGTSTSFDWLVDVEANCVAPAPENATFLALSYVWGQIPMLKTTRANISVLQQPGSLSGVISNSIPATIKHAMGLVRGLGQKYLWVDSLCIVQDDTESVRRHIERLAAIFESAALTIVAADGENANGGLKGIKGVSEPREIPPVLVLGDTLSVTSRTSERITHSRWSTRGWTLQEGLFSRKKLVFIGNSVRFFCHSNTYYEEIESPLDMASSRLRLDGAEHKEKRSIVDLATNYPDMAKLIDLLADYCRRALSFDDDILRAISSTLKALGRAFPHGLIYGLPVSFLDAALLWRSYGHLQIRKSSLNSHIDCPPSWTWAGWKGSINSHYWTSSTYIKDPPFAWFTAHHRDFQAIPILNWHTCSSKHSKPIPISFHSEWYNYKKLYMGKSTGLPPGWSYELEDMDALRTKALERQQMFKETPDITAFEDPDCPIASEDSEELQTHYFYSHISAPGLKFWHPVPIGNNGETIDEQNADTAQYGRFLWAKTHQSTLWAAEPRPSPPLPLAASYRLREKAFVAQMFSTVLGVTTVLRNADNVDVGELQVDTEDDFVRIMECEKKHGETGFPCDLVAISKGFDFVKPMEPDREVYTFYNVLWVVWVDGIAYRRGVGRVKRVAWEALARRDIELILG
jgi:hypothetical protein